MADDTISRKAAIDAIRNIRATTGTHDDEILLIDKAEAQTKLMLLPTAERKGHWILQEDRTKKLYGWHICSECGAWIGEPTKFCSECGADMRGEQ